MTTDVTQIIEIVWVYEQSATYWPPNDGKYLCNLCAPRTQPINNTRRVHENKERVAKKRKLEESKYMDMMTIPPTYNAVEIVKYFYKNWKKINDKMWSIQYVHQINQEYIVLATLLQERNGASRHC
ncbi:37448_t:CDS:2 [Gigaspora margarita]|uniref:37448_t:CDS:1 n=1 Tax=Gigaspora margarita TaxID=4874 RepID=A0ABM8W2G1_GIGMA|nr:37448_t:CDS:2 [Gigaspora margarita]